MSDDEERAALVAEIQRLRAALRWYATDANYDEDHAPGHEGVLEHWIYDRGERARAALR